MEKELLEASAKLSHEQQVIHLKETEETMQHLPLAVRAGVETPGLMTFEARGRDDQR